MIFSAVCLFPLVTVKAQSAEEKIINNEKAVLERRKKGDPFGFIDIASDDINNLDYSLKKRITGIKEFSKHLSSFNGTFSFASYKLLSFEIQRYGYAWVLTCNFTGYSNENKKVSGILRKFIIFLTTIRRS